MCKNNNFTKRGQNKVEVVSCFSIFISQKDWKEHTGNTNIRCSSHFSVVATELMNQITIILITCSKYKVSIRSQENPKTTENNVSLIIILFLETWFTITQICSYFFPTKLSLISLFVVCFDVVLPGVKEDSSSVVPSSDEFAVYLHLPHTGHSCFLFQQEEERDHFLSALKTCIRHRNLGIPLKTFIFLCSMSLLVAQSLNHSDFLQSYNDPTKYL